MTYAKQLQDPRWIKRSFQEKEKADWKCQDCFKHFRETGTLETHHCFYVSWMMLWDYPSELLIVVCPECHKFRQEREQACQIQFAKFMRTLRPGQLDDSMWLFLANDYRGAWKLAGAA